MAHIHVDSELLLHHLPASAFDTTFHIGSVLDKNKNPLLFAIGSDKKLRAFKRDISGTFLPVDVSAKLGLGAVESFAVAQHGSVIFLVLSSHTAEQGTSVTVLSPFTVSELLGADAAFRAKVLQNHDNLSKIHVSRLHINKPDSESWPLLVAIYRNGDGLAQNDAKVARITPLGSKWEWSDDLGIAQVSKGVLDVSGGRHQSEAVGEGLAILNKDVHQDVKLIFMNTARDLNGRYHKEISFPPHAAPCSIAPFLFPPSALGPGGETNFLLIGKGGLFLITSDEMGRTNSEPRCLSTHPMFQQANELTIAQSSGWEFTAWFKTSDGSLAYQRATMSDLGADCELHGDPVPLLDSSSHVVDYVPLLHPALNSQTLIVLNKEREVAMLQHAVASGMWERIPLLVKAPGDVSEVKAYVSRVQITTAGQENGKDRPAAFAKYLLSASRPIFALVNGVEKVVDKTPTPVETNFRGVLTIVSPTDDLGVPTFTLADPPSIPADRASCVLGSPASVDPSQKIFDRLRAMLSTESDVRKVKTADGASFVKGVHLSEEDARSTSKTLLKLCEVHKDLEKVAPKSSSAKDVFHAPSSILETHDGASFHRVVWDFFSSVKQRLTAIGQLVIKKLRDTWHFVCEIAGKAWAFVLDCKEAVCKALVAIGHAIGEGAHMLWNGLKSLLDFESISATAKSIQQMVTKGLDFAANRVATKRESIDAAFARFEKNALGWLNLKLPPKLAEKREKASADKAQSGAGVKESYGLYHFEHGAQDATSKSAVGVAVDSLKAIWQDLLKPPLEDFWDTFKAIADVFIDAVKSGEGVSIADVFKQIGGALISTVIQFFKKLLAGIMKLSEDLLTGLNEILNAPLEIPVLSWLLRKFGVTLPSILSIISFVLAFMTVETSRIVVGRPPERVMNINFEVRTSILYLKLRTTC
ncbi:hypothetical protein DL93DRAFT_1711422 [Clavulina sp. PMI_390]|nr:hypothetical protein DL93DRAFT_1711422 [Clavulina sp. PMI_390]